MQRFIGLMSGTSLDGVDAVLADLQRPGRMTVLAHAHRPFDDLQRRELLALNQRGEDELHRAAQAAHALMHTYAQAVEDVLARSGLGPSQVRALGAHGQTVRHQPRAFLDTGYTTQLMNGALLAELTGIDVVCDFRSRDVAAGGQGAPLVPAFHAAWLGEGNASQALTVLNIGGIANVTLLRPGHPTLGFDTGPGNALMDLWCQRHTGQAFDHDGHWAASGQVCAALLERGLAHPYFELAPPKSTGRDDFHASWLQTMLDALPSPLPPQDVQATLLELTAQSIARAMPRWEGGDRKLWVCGGGAFNGTLLSRLQALLPGWQVKSTQSAGLAPDRVEALAFAWLAQRFLAREPGNLVSATGARGPRVLGALYPA